MPNCTNAPSAIFWLLSAIAACRCAHSIHRPTKRRRRLLKKLRRNARSKTPRSYQRKAARNLVPGRGAHWPARHADPCLGQTRDAPPCAARSALRMGLHFWRRLPAAPHHRSPRRADRQHRSHVHASQRNRGQRRTGRARSPCSRRRWISSRHRPRRTRQHLRGNKLSNTIYENYDDILEKACQAWMFFANDKEQVASITTRQWAKVNL